MPFPVGRHRRVERLHGVRVGLGRLAAGPVGRAIHPQHQLEILGVGGADDVVQVVLVGLGEGVLAALRLQPRPAE